MFKQPVTYLLPAEEAHDRSRRRLIFRTAAEAGIEHIVLSDKRLEQLICGSVMLHDVLADMKEAHLDFVDAHAIYGRYRDLNCPLLEERPAMIASHRYELEVCARLGVDTITIHTGNSGWLPKGQEPSEDRHVELIEEALEQLLPDAERLGVTICIENIWWPINTPERLLEIKAKFPTDALGFCYDAGHANLMKCDRHVKHCAPMTWIDDCGHDSIGWDDKVLEKMLPYITNCHLHDNDGLDDQHTIPYAGNVDWNHVIGLLKKAPRLRNIQSEAVTWNYTCTLKELADAFARLGEIPEEA